MYKSSAELQDLLLFACTNKALSFLSLVLTPPITLSVFNLLLRASTTTTADCPAHGMIHIEHLCGPLSLLFRAFDLLLQSLALSLSPPSDSALLRRPPTSRKASTLSCSRSNATTVTADTARATLRLLSSSSSSFLSLFSSSFVVGLWESVGAPLPEVCVFLSTGGGVCQSGFPTKKRAGL